MTQDNHTSLGEANPGRTNAGQPRPVEITASILRRWKRSIWPRALALLVLPSTLLAVTLDELLNATELTPSRFARHFQDFTYKFHDDVQAPEQFLATGTGDCDDYAVLADVVLRKHGYTTKLVAVRMPGLVAHAVCYVLQEREYLDFNNRVYLSRTVKCDPELDQIARKVAKSFDANWTSVSEFTYTNGVKYLVRTVAKTDQYARPEEAAPPAEKPAKPKIVIDF
ncbi:MAG: transglutaminase domain-containing protein [Verrucomicrobiota bacterium]